MSYRKIALVVNPIAGKGRANAIADLLAGHLYNYAIEYSLFINEWPASFSGFSDVWIIGGDGTLNYFINHYPDIKIPLVIFKGGTGNDFAWKLYGNIDWKEQLQLVLHTEAKPVDAGICNNKLFLNGVGIGFDGEVLNSMDTIRFMGGHLGYFLVVIKKIFSFKESRFIISVNEEIIADERLLLVMINNSSRTGGGFHVSPRASVKDGLLDLVTSQPLSVLKRLKYLPKIEKGKHLDLPFISHCANTCFTVTCEKALPAQLDGELVVADKFECRVLPEKFLFLY
ncbi:MAG TPA: diacylglycerol kinase family protein [Chitinophagaceae bacterium]|nr:diacylglycerol kinase family protein [Chitinophagaceae bacterium]